jgi:hypothetical protein
MASPDERQGDHTATTTCYFCNEVPNRTLESLNPKTAGLDVPLRPTASANSTSIPASASVAEEQTVLGGRGEKSFTEDGKRFEDYGQRFGFIGFL